MDGLLFMYWVMDSSPKASKYFIANKKTNNVHLILLRDFQFIQRWDGEFEYAQLTMISIIPWEWWMNFYEVSFQIVKGETLEEARDLTTKYLKEYMKNKDENDVLSELCALEFPLHQ